MTYIIAGFAILFVFHGLGILQANRGKPVPKPGMFRKPIGRTRSHCRTVEAFEKRVVFRGIAQK